jgi:hypothetical protein
MKNMRSFYDGRDKNRNLVSKHCARDTWNQQQQQQQQQQAAASSSSKQQQAAAGWNCHGSSILILPLESSL